MSQYQCDHKVTMKFTDKYTKGLSGKKSAYRIYEKNLDKGFGAKVTPAGSVSFFIQYSSDNKTRFYNLGRYPSVSLAEARERCRETRLLIDRGIDPQNQQETSFGTVEKLFDYYAQSMRDAKKRTWGKVISDLKYNCSAIISMQAKDVMPVHIRQILHSIIERGSMVQSNRIRSYLHRAFKLGILHDNDPKNLKNNFTFNITLNPVDSVPKDQSVESVGETNLSFSEIKTLWNSPNLSERFGIAVKILLMYGCRPWELMGAEKKEFDYNSMVWSIPPDRVKNKRWLLLPITPLAEQLLTELIPHTRDSIYLFPSRYKDDKTVGKTSLQHATNKVTELKFTPRDLRRTVKTRMGEIGIEKSIRDRLQNHALTDVSSKHYDRYDYLPEKREALLKWEDKLRETIALKEV